MYWVQLASRVLHVLGAIVLVGGLFYQRMIVLPRLRASDAEAGTDPWYAGRRGAWAMWVGIATLVLLATGLFNFVQIIRTNDIATSYHMIVGVKILAALVVFFLAAMLAGKSPLADQFRQNMKLWLTACLVAAMLVVMIGSVMRSYPRHLKPVAGPTLIAPSN